MRIVFDTWQFVRIMVRLEETHSSDRQRAALWNAWADDWRRVDAELEALRTKNFEKFAAAMMDEEVIFDPVDADTVRTVAKLSRDVAKALKISARNAPRETRDDLEFERTSLLALSAQLDRLVQQSES